MKPINYLVTWMYSPSEDQRIVHHQTGNSSQQKTQNLYWRCVFCLFESSHRNNKDLFKHVLYLNRMPPEQIDGISTAELIKTFNIEIYKIDEQSLPPRGYYKAWSSQFLLLDILRQMTGYVRAEDRVVVLDSDVIFSKPVPADFLDDLDKHRSLLYTIKYPVDREVNGVSLQQLREMMSDMTNLETNNLYCEGGELVCFKGEILDQLRLELNEGFRWSLKRYEQGLPKFNTEEHLFSVAYWKLGLKPFTGNKYIKRLWTDLSSAVNIETGDEQRLLWHLPGEKKKGFVRYFRLMGKNNNSLAGFEQELKSMFRIKPTMRDKLAMMARIPFKKTYKLLKAI